MARIVDDSSKYEAWKTTTRSAIVLTRLDAAGKIMKETVRGLGKVFHITPEERRLNQEACSVPAYDWFQNGKLTPVRLIETTEDVEALKNNPNVMSESDMQALFKLKTVKTFQDKVSKVTNMITLNRMMEIATAEETDATHRQVEIVKAALEEHSPTSQVNEVKTVSGPTGAM